MQNRWKYICLLLSHPVWHLCSSSLHTVIKVLDSPVNWGCGLISELIHSSSLKQLMNQLWYKPLLGSLLLPNLHSYWILRLCNGLLIFPAILPLEKQHSVMRKYKPLRPISRFLNIFPLLRLPWIPPYCIMWVYVNTITEVGCQFLKHFWFMLLASEGK